MLFASNIIAQPAQNESLPNGFLVKFKSGVTPENVRAKNILRGDTGIREGEYFEHLDIWYIKYEPAKISQNVALQRLGDDPSVLRLNPIRKVEYRGSIPNDDYFGVQWAFYNTGQGGGTPGADISAVDAWDITKGYAGGTHEYILAVVDGGFDQAHEDLEFLSGGYDAYNDDYTVPVSDHGTHVSGILGAKADNIDGVAGVNWDTKIFPVAGSSSNELVVTRAYDHILGLRKQYNSQRDAIVAALNFNIFARHAERVKGANIAQMINVLQAMIHTDQEKMVLTPTYHAFRMYVPFQNATRIPIELDAGTYNSGDVTLPQIDAIAAKDDQGRILIAITNVDPNREVTIDLSLMGQSIEYVKAETLYAPEIDAINTFENPDAVSPEILNVDGSGTVTLKPQSVSVFIIEDQ